MKVDILLHQDVDVESEEVKSEIAAAAHVDPKSIDLSGRKVQLTVEQQYLDNVDAVDQVRYIQEVHPITLCNNVARGVLNANVLINGTPYKGEGQVVAVADTGFDNGDISDIPNAFTGRVQKLYALGRPSESLKIRNTHRYPSTQHLDLFIQTRIYSTYSSTTSYSTYSMDG